MSKYLERITSKYKDGYLYELAPNQEIFGWENGVRLVQIVGQLEDIEEEFGIDLIQAVDLCKKVNKQGYVYTKESWGISKLQINDELDVEIFKHRLYSNNRGIYYALDINEYGIEWALTREELE